MTEVDDLIAQLRAFLADQATRLREAQRLAEQWERQWRDATTRAERAEKLVVTHFIARQEAERHAAELAQALAVAEEDKI